MGKACLRIIEQPQTRFTQNGEAANPDLTHQGRVRGVDELRPDGMTDLSGPFRSDPRHPRFAIDARHGRYTAHRRYASASDVIGSFAGTNSCATYPLNPVSRMARMIAG